MLEHKKYMQKQLHMITAIHQIGIKTIVMYDEAIHARIMLAEA